MIRILHTADWHIGATLRGHDRENEHRAALDRVVAIAVERDVHAVVVAGDVFDAFNPSASSQALLYRTLTALARARPGTTVVITAGNHDSSSRLEAPRPVLGALDVHVVGSVRRREGVVDADRHLVPVHVGRDVAAQVLAVSYPTAGCLPVVAAEGAGSPVARAVASLYEDLWSRSYPRHGGVPVVLTGHLHVAGGIETEASERRILVGGEHAVGHDVFPVAAAYVGLGHLHRAQRVGRDSVRYSGSLLPLSATEMGYDHGVALVTLDGGVTTVEHVPVERPLPFLRVPAHGEATLSDLGDHLASLDLPLDLPLGMRPFVQVHLSRDGLPPGYREEADRIAAPFAVRVVDIKVPVVPDVAADIERVAVVTTRLADIDPGAVFEVAFIRRFGRAPSAEHRRVFALLREEG